MTPEELQQIQAIIQAAVAPLATKQEIQTLETKIAAVEIKIATVETKLDKNTQSLEAKITAVETKVEKSEQKILTKLDQLELLAADYLDGQVQTTKRRLDRVEKHLNLTP